MISVVGTILMFILYIKMNKGKDIIYFLLADLFLIKSFIPGVGTRYAYSLNTPA